MKKQINKELHEKYYCFRKLRARSVMSHSFVNTNVEQALIGCRAQTLTSKNACIYWFRFFPSQSICCTLVKYAVLIGENVIQNVHCISYVFQFFWLKSYIIVKSGNYTVKQHRKEQFFFIMFFVRCSSRIILLVYMKCNTSIKMRSIHEHKH